MAGYWGDYWQANYWNADYWNEGAAPAQGDYWTNNYWNANYWHANYWLDTGAVTTVTVEQASTPQLAFGTPQSSVVITVEILPGTPALTLTPLVTDTANDVAVEAALASLSLTALNTSPDSGLGDIGFTVFTSSAFGFTDTVNAGVESLSLTAITPDIELGTSTVVGVNSTPSLSLTALNTTTSNPVSVVTGTPALSLTEYNVDTGFGTVISSTVAYLSLNSPQTNVTNLNRIMTPNVETLSLSALFPAVDDGIANAGTEIVNPFATTDVPVNYEICERSGFRVYAGGLYKDAYGHRVRRQSLDRRHPQDYVRYSGTERNKGSDAPEKGDRFIGEDIPAVTAEDL